MRILGVIPARGGSRGVPRKNIIDLCGRPLLAYTADAALGAASLTETVLSTDDDEIAGVGRALGLRVPFLRPAELARDDTPTVDVLVHLLGALAEDGEEYDALCLLQPTTPLRDAAMVEAACGLYLDSDADTLLSVLPVPAHHHPDWSLVETAPGRYGWATGGREPPPRRQALRPAWHREGSIYIARSDLVRRRRTLYGDRVAVFPVDEARSVNIDEPADLERARELLGGRR